MNYNVSLITIIKLNYSIIPNKTIKHKFYNKIFYGIVRLTIEKISETKKP